MSAPTLSEPILVQRAASANGSPGAVGQRTMKTVASQDVVQKIRDNSMAATPPTTAEPNRRTEKFVTFNVLFQMLDF